MSTKGENTEEPHLPHAEYVKHFEEDNLDVEISGKQALKLMHSEHAPPKWCRIFSTLFWLYSPMLILGFIGSILVFLRLDSLKGVPTLVIYGFFIGGIALHQLLRKISPNFVVRLAAKHEKLYRAACSRGMQVTVKEDGNKTE